MQGLCFIKKAVVLKRQIEMRKNLGDQNKIHSYLMLAVFVFHSYLFTEN